MGVLCRYSTFGFNTARATAVAAPLRDAVVCRISQAIAHAATPVLATEITTADAPVRYRTSSCAGSMFKRCGKGSQTAPTCCHPGVRLSRIRRATTRCARAS